MKKIAITALALLMGHSSLQSQDGELDLSFNGDGKFVLKTKDTDEWIADVVMQPDGKFLCVGTSDKGGDDNIIALRLDGNGNPDLKFGSQGIVNTTFLQDYSSATAIGLDASGRILIAGTVWKSSTNEKGLAVKRLFSDGTEDFNFGNGGYTLLPLDANTQNFHFIHGLPNGKILVGGKLSGPNGIVPALARFNSDGSPDYNFGDSAIAVIPRQSTSIIIERYVMRPDGGVQGVGYTYVNGQENFALAQFDAQGNPDAAFGSNGISVVNFSDEARGQGLTLQRDGKSIAVGYIDENNQEKFAITRLLADGTLDQSFGVNGKAIVPILQGDAEATSVHVLGDGKIIVAGQADGIWNINFAVARLSSAGTLDKSFNLDGFVTRNIGNGNDYSQTSVLQPNGRLVVFGTALNLYTTGSNTDSYDFAAARFLAGQGYIGLGELEADIAMDVYPNPATDWLGLSFEEYQTSVQLSIMDQRGSTVKELQLNNFQESQIDVNDLYPGLYVLKFVLSDGKTIHHKIAIRH